MKSLFRLPNLLLLAVAIFAFAACTEDPEFKIPPSVDLLEEAGFLSADATLAAGTPIRVKISGSKGDNPMSSVEFQENGVRIGDATRITIDGVAASSAAPILFDAEKDALTWEVEITPHTEGTSDYSFVISDDGGESSSTSLTITIESTPPTLTAPSGVFELLADAGGLTSINLMATNPSGAALTSIAVWEGGAIATGADRFWFGSIMAEDAFEGEFTLLEADQNGFTKDLFIRANAVSGTTDSYTIQVTDANGITASLDITVEAKTTTPLDMTLTGVLLNASGPVNTGGLDLDSGNGDVGSNDPTADIKDEGNVAPGTQDWKQQISASNNSTLRFLPVASFPDGFTFSDVASKEVVLTAWDAATEMTVSDQVAVDDVFVVFNPDAPSIADPSILEDRYYLLQVTNINLTTTDNADSYTFSIKW